VKRLIIKFKRSGYQANKRIRFLNFLKAYLRFDKLTSGFIENLEAIQLDCDTFPWIDPFLIALYQGQSVASALNPLRHYFDELDYAYFILCLSTNQLRDFAHYFIHHREQTSKIKTKIKTQASYPLFLIGISLMLLVLLQVFLLPQYRELMNNLGLKDSPSIDLHAYITIGIIFLSLIIAIMQYFPRVKTWLVPIFLELEIIAWAETLDLGLKAQLPLIECLILTDHHVKFNQLSAFTQSFILQLRLGFPINSALQYAPKILQDELYHYHGEDDFFLKLMLKFQSKVLHRLQQLERFIQPVLLLVVTLICLYFFYHLYQPLFRMALF